MSKIPPPLTELEFKEMLRDCFNRGEIGEWSAHRGWKNRSSGSRALNWKEEQDSNLYEAYLDLYAARMVGQGLVAKLWDTFSRAVFPLIREAEPVKSSDLAAVKLHFNNWESLERAREEGGAFAEECEAARKRAVEFLANYKPEGKTIYPARAHMSNRG